MNNPQRRTRVILNTDAKNEADDQFAIVHAVLTPSFEIEGIIAAHFGTEKSARSMEESREEIDLLLGYLGGADRLRVENGAPHAIPDESTPVRSRGAELIVEAALRDDPRPLHLAFLGPLTDMASALLMEPRIQDRNLRVIWIGGGPWPDGRWEYNLMNDIASANVVFRSRLEVWQIPSTVFRRMEVSYAELEEKVAPSGELGRYLVDQLYREGERWMREMDFPPLEYWCLGDSPAVGVIMYPGCGRYAMRPAPQIAPDMRYVHAGMYRDIRVYEDIDARFIYEDFFAKLRRFSRDDGSRSA